MIRPLPVAIVTGASGGIGRYIAFGLARAGYHTIVVCRDKERGQALQGWIGELIPDARTKLRVADLRNLHATHALGCDLAAAYPRVAILVNNAGLFTAHRQITEEGREAVLALNHLSPMVFTNALEPALRAAAPSRIVNIGSSSSDRACIDPDNLELGKSWGMVRAYARSKLALMIATFARAEALAGTGVVANIVHPGTVSTGLIREGGAIGLAWRLMAPFVLTEEQGADTPLHVVLAPEWGTISGQYVKRRRAVAPNRLALDRNLRARVMASSRALLPGFVDE